MNPVSARTRLITERQLGILFPQLLHQLLQRRHRIGDLPQVTHFATSSFGDRNRNRLFVHIHPNVLAKLLHDLPPQLRL